MPDEPEWRAEGERALRAGDWIVACDAFQEALGQAETPEALNGLGEALWWLGATQDSIAARERAYAAFRHRRNPAETWETQRHRPAGLPEPNGWSMSSGWRICAAGYC